MKHIKVITLTWILSCAMLLGAGLWLRIAGEELGAYFMFAGLLIASLYCVAKVISTTRRQR